MTFEEHMKKSIEEGYTVKNGKPLKCTNCENTTFNINILDANQHGILEYEEFCKKCSTVNGQWSYGHWQV